jgi:hypothetical protein
MKGSVMRFTGSFSDFWFTLNQSLQGLCEVPLNKGTHICTHMHMCACVHTHVHTQTSWCSEQVWVTWVTDLSPFSSREWRKWLCKNTNHKALPLFSYCQFNQVESKILKNQIKILFSKRNFKPHQENTHITTAGLAFMLTGHCTKHRAVWEAVGSWKFFF